MSRDTILRDEDGRRYSYDNIRMEGWSAGHMPGAECAVSYLRTKAVDLFKRRRHDEAKAMQELADEMEKKLIPELRDLAQKRTEEYPPLLEDEADPE